MKIRQNGQDVEIEIIPNDHCIPDNCPNCGEKWSYIDRSEYGQCHGENGCLLVMRIVQNEDEYYFSDEREGTGLFMSKSIEEAKKKMAFGKPKMPQ